MIIQNPKILQFFSKHPDLQPETVLLNFIKLTETILESNGNTTNSDYIDYTLINESLNTSINNVLAPHLVNEQNVLSNIYSQLSELLRENKISALKGKRTEGEYLSYLTSVFKQSEIQNCSQIDHAMDILLRQEGHTDIRFDIKDYTTNVPSKEVQKFKSDISHNNCHGILVSDKSGIANKNNFSFDVINNRYIAFYITNSKDQMENIIYAINFIRSMESLITKNNGIYLSDTVIKSIQLELEKYTDTVSSIKKNLQSSIQLCNTLSFNTISSIFQFNSSLFVCDICNQSFDTKRKLTFHLKTH
jgi:hypothetical protein